MFGSKYEEESIFVFLRKFFLKVLPRVIWNANLANLPKLFYANVRKIISTSETEQRISQNFQIVFFLKKTILWTLGKQFWQPPPQKSLTKNSREIQKQKHPKKFLWTPNLPLKDRSQMFLPLSERFSLEDWKTKKSFLKTLFSSKCSPGRNEQKFGHTTNFFLIKFRKKFSSMPGKIGKRTVFIEKKSIFLMTILLAL